MQSYWFPKEESIYWPNDIVGIVYLNWNTTVQYDLFGIWVHTSCEGISVDQYRTQGHITIIEATRKNIQESRLSKVEF